MNSIFKYHKSPEAKIVFKTVSHILMRKLISQHPVSIYCSTHTDTHTEHENFLMKHPSRNKQYGETKDASIQRANKVYICFSLRRS